MEDHKLKIETIDDGILSLTIATDKQRYFEDWFVPALDEAVKELSGDQTLRVVVVEGGERYFCAGASRDMLLSSNPQSTDWRSSPEIPRLMLSIPVPTVAAMAGHALGGGFILGLWCDIAVMAEESLYGANFIKLGITPGMGSTALLEDSFGAPLARELLLSGRILKGREIKALGGPLAHSFVARQEVRERAISIATEIAEVPRHTLILLKEAISGSRREKFEQATRKEQEMHAILFGKEETRIEIAERYAEPILAANVGEKT